MYNQTLYAENSGKTLQNFNLQIPSSFNFSMSASPYAQAMAPYQTALNGLYQQQNYINYSPNDSHVSSGYSSAGTTSYNNSPLVAPSTAIYYNKYQSSPVICYNEQTTTHHQPQQKLKKRKAQDESIFQVTAADPKRKCKADESFSLDDIINSVQNKSDSINDQTFDSLNTTNDDNKKKRVLNRTQRVAANNRERKRMNIMNDAFGDLRQCLPLSTGRKRRKMSRLDIVIGAMEYIAYLDSILENNERPMSYYQNLI